MSGSIDVLYQHCNLSCVTVGILYGTAVRGYDDFTRLMWLAFVLDFQVRLDFCAKIFLMSVSLHQNSKSCWAAYELFRGFCRLSQKNRRISFNNVINKIIFLRLNVRKFTCSYCKSKKLTEQKKKATDYCFSSKPKPCSIGLQTCDDCPTEYHFSYISMKNM